MSGLSSKLRAVFASRQMGLLLIIIIIYVAFGAADPAFRDPANLLDRTRHWVEVGILAVTMTWIIVSGGIDLSVGSIVAMSGIIGGMIYRDLHWPMPLALLAVLAAGAAGGAFNGWLISTLRVPALVATLATMALFRGVAMGLTQARPISSFPPTWNLWGGTAALTIGALPIPIQTIILIAVGVIGAIVLGRTRLGRWSLQIGENEKAARLAAIPIRKVIFILYLASGLASGLAGCLSMLRFATARPDAGLNMELEAIACVVIGGTRITGGQGSVLGTMLGLVMLGLLRFGMDMRGVPQQHQSILIGVMVIAAAIINEWITRLGERRARGNRSLGQLRIQDKDRTAT